MTIAGDSTGRSTKKVRRRPKESLDLDNPMVNDRDMKVGSARIQTVSRKEKLLMGTASKRAII